MIETYDNLLEPTGPTTQKHITLEDLLVSLRWF
jgi:hypothetical protein